VLPALPTGTKTTPLPKQNLPHEVCTTTANDPNWANKVQNGREEDIIPFDKSFVESYV
jgi:hypothetical protein